MLDITPLKSILSGLVTMKANTAMGFILLGVSLQLSLSDTADQQGRRIAQGCALVVLTLAVLTLAEYLFNWNLGIDQLLFTEPSSAVGTSQPGRMAPNTVLNFLLAGSALLLLDVETRRSRRPAQFLTLAAGLVSLLAFVGYAYSVESLYGIASYTEMPLHTVMAFIVLCAGVLCARPDHGVMTVVTSDSTGGIFARRLLVVAFVIPVILGWLRLKGQQAGLYDTEFGVSLMAVSIIIIFSVLTWWTGRSLEQPDAERKQAEERLQESQERLNLALKSSGVGAWSWDVITNSMTWDPYTHPLFGLKPGAFGGRYEDFLNIIHPDDRERVTREVANSLELDAEYKTEYRVVWPEGTIRFLASGGRTSRDKDGRAVRMTGVCWDVTERKRAEEALRAQADLLHLAPAAILMINIDITERKRAQERLKEFAAQMERTNRELQEFAYVASHDLQEPLRKIQAFGNRLADKYANVLPDEARDYVGRMRNAARRMQDLIDDLLTLSRVTTTALPFSSVDLTAVAQRVAADLQAQIERTNGRVEIADLPTIDANRVQMRQLLQNLISNALKFHREDEPPVVKVYSKADAGENDLCVLVVEDNGIKQPGGEERS